ncbi:MAG: hypothetical protein WBH85_05235 [Thermoanaerobaculia bacterium]
MDGLWRRLAMGVGILCLGLAPLGCGGKIDDSGEGKVRTEVEQAVDRVQSKADQAQEAADRAEYYLEHGEMPPEEETEDQEQ